jgi:hypothetical protein
VVSVVGQLLRKGVDVMHLLFRDQSVLVMELVYEKVSQQFILKSFPAVHLTAFLVWFE